MPRRKPTSDVGTALARLNALSAETPVIPGAARDGEDFAVMLVGAVTRSRDDAG